MLTIAQLRELDDNALRMLNSNIVDVMRQRQRERAFEASRKFRVGDHASFIHQGRKVTIEIQRFNEKTVGGVALDANGNRTASRWRVAPSFLTKVEKEVAKPTVTPRPAGDKPATVGAVGTF